MTKPIVHYRGEAHFLFGLAYLTPVDHPNHLVGHDVSNNVQVATSRVIEHDINTGRIETRNTIYIPLKEEGHENT